MYNIETNIDNGYVIISDNFDILSDVNDVDYPPTFENINDEYVLSFVNLNNISKIVKFNYDSIGINENRYLVSYYRISRDNKIWSEWLELSANIDNFPTVDVKDKLSLEIKWIRQGSSITDKIMITNYIINGLLSRNEESLNGDLKIVRKKSKLIITVPYIYKVFKLTDFNIYTNNSLDNITIKYRYSQDNSRTWSEWENLTKENISTTRISPIRFFQIEYMINNESNNDFMLNNIALLGDFQNITTDGKKTNLFGIKECCPSQQEGYYDSNGNFIANTNLNSFSSNNTCDVDNMYNSMTDDEKAQLYNPYKQSEAFKLIEKLSTDSEQISGHNVKYFITDPDKNGQDHSLNEYQLYNIMCSNNIKVSINGNDFPDSQIKMNIFELDLFDTMEAHITKKQFKEIFGYQRRPSKEDFLYFCDVNRMYQVDHSQQFRSFNNSSIYYKLILKKYNQKSNVRPENIQVSNTLENLIKNSAIDDLFANEIKEDKKSIANKPQTSTLTKDLIRLSYNSDIDKELIENGSTVISKSNYDLNSINKGSIAVEYKNINSSLEKSDNRSFFIWFNIKNYINDDIYNFINMYDNHNSLGLKINLINDKFILTLNNSNYEFKMGEYTGDPMALEENTWYCYLLNINQRNNYIEHYVYKRNVDYEEDSSKLSSNILRKVYYNKQNINPSEFTLDNINPKILGSDMKITNIRLFNDVIPENIHNKMLNLYIIGNDYRNLIFADNATARIYLYNMPYNE